MKPHWSKDTFHVVAPNQYGKTGYCSVCFADMFLVDGRLTHTGSHAIASTLSLWGKKLEERLRREAAEKEEKSGR